MSASPTPGDLRGAARTRQAGMRPWIWYTLIGLGTCFAGFLIVQAVLPAPSHPRSIQVASSSSTSTRDRNAVDGGEDSSSGQTAGTNFRYTGRVVDSQNGRPAPAFSPTPQPASSPLSTGIGGIPSAAPIRSVADISDVTSQAYYATHRIPLPTPAPVGNVPDPQSLRPHMVVVYGQSVSSNGSGSTIGGSSGASSGLDPTVLRMLLAAASQGAPAQSGGPSAAPASPTPAASGPTERSATSETMVGRRRPPSARYVIPAGTFINVQLDTPIQSDIAGPGRAHVVDDVLCPLTGSVCIPRLSTVLYDYTGLSSGQQRLAIVWRRVIFPDLSSFSLDQGGTSGTDEAGRNGVGGQVDDHRGPLFKQTAISSLLAALAVKLSGSGQTSSNLVVVEGGSGISTVGQPFIDLANRLNAQSGNLPPTISIKETTPVQIFVNRDMIFDGPYAPQQVE